MEMTREEVVDVLANTARRLALESSADHPEDLGICMQNAIESAAVALSLMRDKERSNAPVFD